MTERTYLAAFLVVFQVMALSLPRNIWAGCEGLDRPSLNKLPHDSSGDEYRADLYLADGNYIVVDDMESYNDSNNYIWDTWWDGCGDGNGVGGNGTRSCIELAIDPCDPVHGGTQSMLYAYDNREYGDRCPDYSEIIRQYDPPADWASHGEKALTLWFYGNPDNNSTDMWVVLGSTSAEAMATYGDNGEDPEDIKKQEWMEWNIKLSDFADGGVDLANVGEILIGFGNRSGVPDGTTGTVYFDDIRLYPRRCVERFAPPADFTGDCLVDWRDLKILAQQWLYAGEGAPQGDAADCDAANPGVTALCGASDYNECQASGPSPGDGQTEIQSARTEVTLCWTEAECVAGTLLGRNFLYFGTSFDDVYYAPEYSYGWDSPEEFVALLVAGDNCCNVGTLPLWKTYYWRVDERCEDGSYCKGNVWSFTTGCDLAASDLNIDCLVNLTDYTTLAGSWFEQAPLWPPE